MKRRYKLIFIDDEKVILDSFLDLIDWDACNYEVSGAFRDGEDAWNFVRENDVDIIVSDINMPFMDGLELLRRLREIHSRARCIFLTGYDSFQYAKKAVQMKAFDYLLKPVKKDELFDAVERAAFDIEKEENIYEEADRGRKLAKIHFLRKILNEKEYNSENGVSVDQELFPEGSYLLMALVLEGLDRHERELVREKEPIQRILLHVKETIEKSLEKTFQMYFIDEMQPQYMKFVLASEEKNLFSNAFIQNFAIECYRSDELDRKYCLIAGKCQENAIDLKDTYRRLNHIMEHRHNLKFKPWNLIIADDSIKIDEEEKITLPTDTLLHHIRSGMTDEVNRDIGEIMKDMRESGNISLSAAKMIATELAIVGFMGESQAADGTVSQLYYLNEIQK